RCGPLQVPPASHHRHSNAAEPCKRIEWSTRTGGGASCMLSRTGTSRSASYPAMAHGNFDRCPMLSRTRGAGILGARTEEMRRSASGVRELASGQHGLRLAVVRELSSKPKDDH